MHLSEFIGRLDTDIKVFLPLTCMHVLGRRFLLDR